MVPLFSNDTYKRQHVRCAIPQRCGDTASLGRMIYGLVPLFCNIRDVTCRRQQVMYVAG